MTMTKREEMLALALQDWLNYAEDNLSEFDLEECFADAETTLCPRCQISGCINLKIRTARSALSAFKDSAQDSALRSAASTGPDVAWFEACRETLKQTSVSTVATTIYCRGIGEIPSIVLDDESIDRIIAALPAPSGESVTGWRPIETAPKDGRYIIAGRFRDDELKWVKHARWMSAEEACEEEGGSSADDYEAGWTDGENEHDYCYPTHWQPLPEPPTIQRKSQSEAGS